MPKTIVLERHPHPRHPRLIIDRRSNSRFYQARTFLDGKLVQKSTKTPHLPTALKLAEEWYKRLLRGSITHGKHHPIAQVTSDPTFAELFKGYYGNLERKKQADALKRWSPITDFWRTVVLSELTTQTFKDFYTSRRKRNTVSNHTLHKDVVLVRQILKYAMDENLLSTLPRIPPTGKISNNPRPWFTPTEWTALVLKAKERIDTAPNVRSRQQRQDAYDFIEFLHASMLRVDELRSLRFRSCRVERNADGDKMLLCEVSGKRGTRTCVAHAIAALVYEDRLKSATIDDFIFPHHCRDAFRELLVAAKMRENEQGFERNLKSVRATSISHKLLEDPDVNLMLVARNAGTSVAMIDEFYAKRLSAEMHKDRLSILPAPATLKVEKQWRQLAHMWS